MERRSVGAPVLVAVIYAALTSAVYFSLGVVADRALGLTPLVFLAGAVFFGLAAMTYVEGAALHQERGGSSNFARYAFNELWSFVAGWAILLDYVILVAVCAFSATNYMAAFWSPLGGGALEFAACAAVIALVTVLNIGGLSARRYRRLIGLVAVDLTLQVVLIVLGLALLLDLGDLTSSVDLGRSPSWGDLLFALPITAVAFTGLEAASGLAGEVRITRGGLRRLVTGSTLTVAIVYVGIAAVAVSALPEVGGRSPFASGRARDAPLIAVADALDPPWLGRGLMYLIGIAAALLLVAAANSAMLGVSRLSYSLATNRQIPSALGRLHPTRATPYVAIVIAAAVALALVVPQDLDALIGIYAFGAMLAFTIAHVSICVLRYREPDRPRPYRVPWSVRVGAGSLPLPAVLGALLSGAGWVTVVLSHTGARIVGASWMVAGLALYVAYRLWDGKPVFKRVTIPQGALQAEPRAVEYRSILVPLSGNALDDDIVQTAGRLASEDPDLTDDEPGAVIEALWIFEMPLALPIDGSLPDAQLAAGRAALARAKAVGEEYEGVEVKTATVRARRMGQAIVDQARRRGVEAIVMAAEEPSRVRGGVLLGGLGGARENFVGDAVKYVVDKAPCRVILTAPPAAAVPAGERDGNGAGQPADPRPGLSARAPVDLPEGEGRTARDAR